MQDEELAYGLRSVAGPITSPDGRVRRRASTSPSRPATGRPSGSCASCGPRVLDTCAEISGLLSDTTAGAVTSGCAPPEARARGARRRPARALRRDRRRPPRPGPAAVPAGRRRRAARGPVQRVPAAAAAGLGAAGARRRGPLRHRARRPVPRDRDPGRRGALGLRVRVVRARGGRPARRADRRRARRRAGRPTAHDELPATRRAAVVARHGRARCSPRRRPRRRRVRRGRRRPRARPASSSCSPWSATTPRSPCSCASSASPPPAPPRPALTPDPAARDDDVAKVTFAE